MPAWEVSQGEAAFPTFAFELQLSCFHRQQGECMLGRSIQAEKSLVFTCRVRAAAGAYALLFALGAATGATAQSAPATASPSGADAASLPQAPQPQTRAQKVSPVTTTVVVHAEVKDDYAPPETDAGGLGQFGTVQETPMSIMVATRALMNDQVARVLSDVVKNDASIGEDYAPVGYYGDFEIRGFPIDLASGLEINGLTIAGEQDVPLENKQSVEFLKGIAGVESGVASAGGLIDYVTKRPAVVRAIDVATDHRGSSFGAVDMGRFFGAQKQVGARLNLAGEKIQSYVNDADGWRAMGAGAADWKMSPKSIVKTDFEYQHKLERSVCGYQLLGGTTLPDLRRIFPSTMLGEQSWEKPNTFDTWNASTRVDHELPRGWRAYAQAGFSHSLIDDNVVYAYGCGYEAACQGNGGTAPDYFFAPDGGYDIYDYRDPGELRIDAQAQALLTGDVKTGPVMHRLAGGGELFRRSVQQPGAPPAGAAATVQDGAVYTYVGSENIYQPIAPVAIESPHESAGPSALWEDNHQSAGIVEDRMQLPAHVELVAGGKVDSLRDHNYSLTATGLAASPTQTERTLWLPQYAAKWSPRDSLMVYANYGVLLSLGVQAPWWVANSSEFLDPFFTRQAEAGVKWEPARRIEVSADIFRMRAPFLYPRDLGTSASCGGVQTSAAAPLCFVSNGHETHNGFELNAQGKTTGWLQIAASAAAIHAISSDTGTADFNDKQVINVPRVRTTLFADVAPPKMRGLHLMPGWSYTASKEATRDDLVSVPGYNLFNFGARYSPGGDDGHVTFHLYADNVFDKRYWKDTGASYGDTFVHLGAPATVRLSAHYTF